MKRKPIRLIIYVILLCIAISVVGVAIWQWDNIQALYLYLALDDEEIADKMDDIRNEHHQQLEEDHGIVVRPPSREQSDDLLDGKVTPEEVKESLGIKVPKEESVEDESASDFQDSVSQGQPDTPSKETSSDIDTETEKPPYVETTDEAVSDSKETTVVIPDVPGETTAVAPTKTAQEIVNDCTAELYACKVDVMATLGKMKKEALDIWKTIPKEHRTKEKRAELGFQWLDKCYEYEVEVDSKVRAILEKYRAELKAIGADDSVLDTLWGYYCEEKKVEKAYYLNKYL